MPPPKKRDPSSPSDAGEGREPPSRDGLAEAIDHLLDQIDATTITSPKGGREIVSVFGAKAVNQALDQLVRHPFVAYCNVEFFGEMKLDEADPRYADAVLALVAGTLAGCGEPFGYEQGDVILVETLDRLQSARKVLVEGPPGSQGLDRSVPFAGEILVSLDEAAAYAKISKKTLERMKRDGELPEPWNPGGDGRPALWRWAELRATIQPRARRILAERFPSHPEQEKSD